MEDKINIETTRLLLVPVTEKYISDIFYNFTPEVTKYMVPHPAKDILETEYVVKYFIQKRKEKKDYVYAITLKESDEFLGLVGLHYLDTEKPELGIWTKTSCHGNYYGRESIGALIEYAKKLGYKKLIYPVDKRNIASKKIPIFYNAKLVCSNKEVETLDGRKLYEEIYEITV